MPIGKDDNKDKPAGIGILEASGGGMVLDGWQLRNVIFQNVHIVYNGGPLIMNNVYFVNCTFEMKADKNTQGLALASFSPNPSIAFTAG